MKLLSLALLGVVLSLSTSHAVPVPPSPVESAYANSSLYLTSTQSQELSTASATSGVGYANATAIPGQLTNAFKTIVSAVGNALSFQNEAVTGFTDELTINQPGLTGSAGTLDFNFTVSGTDAFSATAPAFSSMTAIADFVASTATDNLTFTQTSGGFTSGSNFLNVPQTVVVPFTFGTPFSISLDIDFQGDVFDAGAASVSGSFTTIAGTSNVKSLVLSQPLSNYSAQSASGVNYFNTDQAASPQFIPEPGEIALLAAAGMLIVPFLRRKRSA